MSRRVAPPSPPVVGGIPANHSGTGNHPYTRVVIHSAVTSCTRGQARRLAEMNRDGTTGGSWHYATDPGATIQCSFDRYVCWHAPPNARSIGIEMADTPGPLPGMKRGTAAWKAARRAWRWARKDQRLMLRRTAKLAARSLLSEGLPVRFITVRGLRRGERGLTTHANVSRAFGQSTHWDPGFWPRRLFMRWVRAEARRLLEEGK